MGRRRGLSKKIKKLERIVKERDKILKIERGKLNVSESYIYLLLSRLGDKVVIDPRELVRVDEYIASYNKNNIVFTKRVS